MAQDFAASRTAENEKKSSADFFGRTKLHQIHLEMSAAEWEAMQPIFAPGCRSVSALTLKRIVACHTDTQVSACGTHRITNGFADLKTASMMTPAGRGNQTRLELFDSEFDGWPAHLAKSMLHTTVTRTINVLTGKLVGQRLGPS